MTHPGSQPVPNPVPNIAPHPIPSVGEEVRFGVGEIVAWREQQATSFYRVKTGFLRVEVIARAPSPVTLDLLGPGDWVAPLHPAQPSFTEDVVTNTSVELERFPRDEVAHLESVNASGMEGVARRTRRCVLFGLPADLRLAGWLSDTAARFGEAVTERPDWFFFQQSLTLPQLGSLLGLHRATLHTNLNRLQKKGILKRESVWWTVHAARMSDYSFLGES